MNNFNLEALYNLVKKVANRKLINNCIDGFYKKTYSILHFLSYDKLIKVCKALNEYTDFCSIDANCGYNFASTLYYESELKTISNQTFSVEEYDCSDYTIRINNTKYPEFSEWYVVFFIREFWEFCDNFMNESKDESEENMNNKTVETEKEAFSLENIYNIAEHSDKIIHICDELKDIGFNNEEIFEIITNIIKKIG